MKKLKLDHELAELVRNGEKTNTWRLFDDKDLTVNDVVELIDKVNPDQPQSWQVMGTARINKVIEKRFGDITDADYDGHEPHESREVMLATYRSYYGDNVTWDTPVKIVHFDFMPIAEDGSTENNGNADNPPPQRTAGKVIIYADGGSRGNPGHSACGFIIMDEDEEVLVDKGVYLGITTNNQAEYQGLKLALEEARKMRAREVAVRLDSLLVINQMKGVYKVKNRDLWPIHDAVKELVKGFDKVTFTHVPRELNQLADAAVNRVLDEITPAKA
jgi:ribonuclease HI